MRTFTFVPFGKNAPAGAIACDGLVPEAAIDVSHWRGNKTPNELRHDTSVEMALALAEADRDEKRTLVCNNHFDADGVLAVFALLHPEIAREHRDVIVSAAEAGDFDEWPSDERGLMLEIAIARLARADDRKSYAAALAELPTLVPAIASREDLWGVDLERLRNDDGGVTVTQNGAIAILHHAPGISEKPGPMLSRAASPDAMRWLLAFEHDDGTFEYRYEMRRYAWADTTRRRPLAPPSRNAMAVALGDGFAIKGDLGMSGLLRSTRPDARRPHEVAAILARSDTTLSPSP